MKLFVHRKDLRIGDLAGFDYLHAAGEPSLHLLILDPFLLKRDRHLAHSGVNFLRHAVRLQAQYAELGRTLDIVYGDPAEVIDDILAGVSPACSEIVLHADFTPYALVRDRRIRDAAERRGVRVTALVDHTLADLPALQHYAGRAEPYKVYTPFYRKWSEFLGLYHRPASPLTLRDLSTVSLATVEGGPALLARWPLPWALAAPAYPAAEAPEDRLREFVAQHVPSYAERRDHYAYDGTSSLSPAINTGAISIRAVYEAVQGCELAGAWLRQLAWRDFYIYQSLYDADFFSYEKRYDLSALSDRHFDSWRQARTGIPVVDAAMTELNETGRMPNRLRMITAMFLTKNLQCPFTLGEQYFRYKLSDYDNTLNRGGWLWCASLGFDAAPYFRIMNPVTQSQTHDPAGLYIRRWLPALAGLSDKAIHLPLPQAIVDLKASRAAAIDCYRTILQ
ncbi:deoxyribodipyrimidine photo-lyase [Paenibacillus athensensis]|uniref:Deoxyribodipyrimidine photolyase n=1 Tax=Paenibacillus athensensis TaxID=1967502 RepID=A0A4Y8Q8G0_9BACL|nr:deoxyribodipyrimidine photo-lyase [Paenibacillus athensensis]MCD1259984.1 deoxyribodipyrimidine photo-lyase [Paenibacillus athensensis]